MDQINKLVEPGRQFFKDSYRLVKKCTKPDRKGKFFFILINKLNPFKKIIHILEFQKIAFATAIGFAIMGFIGFFVKLIHIPINNIIV
jgi:preprotein translocase subunit Sss1